MYVCVDKFSESNLKYNLLTIRATLWVALPKRCAFFLLEDLSPLRGSLHTLKDKIIWMRKKKQVTYYQ
jgi:hypothetical protein